MIELEIKPAKEAAIIQLIGRLDRRAVPDLETAIREALEAKPRLILLNCESVLSLGSPILQLIVDLIRNTASTQTRIAAVSLSPEAEEIFRLTGFRAVIPSYASEGDAYEFHSSTKDVTGPKPLDEEKGS